MRVVLSCACLLLAFSACQSASSSSPDAGAAFDATTDHAPPNECVAQGFVCQPQAGCNPGYQEVDDLFCGASGAYCCGPTAALDGGVDAAADVVEPDVAADVSGDVSTPPLDGAVEADAADAD